jgi:hypothetical protein
MLADTSNDLHAKEISVDRYDSNRSQSRAFRAPVTLGVYTISGTLLADDVLVTTSIVARA